MSEFVERWEADRGPLEREADRPVPDGRQPAVVDLARANHEHAQQLKAEVAHNQPVLRQADHERRFLVAVILAALVSEEVDLLFACQSARRFGGRLERHERDVRRELAVTREPVLHDSDLDSVVHAALPAGQVDHDLVVVCQIAEVPGDAEHVLPPHVDGYGSGRQDADAQDERARLLRGLFHGTLLSRG